MRIKDKLLKMIREMNPALRIIYASAAGFIAVLAIVLIVVFLPSNRANRALNRADKYFAKQDYANAAAKYLKTLTIKDNILAAYKGLALSESMTDINKAKEDIIQADKKYSEGNIREEDMPDVIDTYLLVPTVFADDPEAQVTLLESGCRVTDNNQELLDALYNAYILKAGSIIDTDYRKASESDILARGIKPGTTGLETVLADKITESAYNLIAIDRFNEVYSLVDEFRDVYPVDADGIVSDAQAAQELYETKIELLSSVYDVMKAYYDTTLGSFSEAVFAGDEVTVQGMVTFDWSAMFEFDGSEAAEILATSFSQNEYIYAPDIKDGYEGLICGLYPYGDPFDRADGSKGIRYYFYFGGYKNGARNGYGFSFAEASDSSYIGFEGEWKDDAPEGFGACYLCRGTGDDNDSYYKRVTYGSFAQGIQNGTMTVKVVSDGASDILFKGTYDAIMGDGVEASISTEEYEILDEIPEDHKLIGVIPSVSEGYNIYVKILQKNGETLSALGY